MMGDVVNLNQYRKERSRRKDRKRATENRARHGLSQTERSTNHRERERLEQNLEGKRLDPNGEPPTNT